MKKMRAYPESIGTTIFTSCGGATLDLVDLKLHYDAKGDYYYLSAIYAYEDEGRVEDIRIHKALLPIDKHHVVINRSLNSSFPTCDIGLGELNLMANDDGQYVSAMVIKEKVHEMTLDEIEKKLGYKVKIINDK